MKDDYGVSVNYNKAWRARERTLEDVRGSLDNSYQKLPSFFYRLKVKNPRTITFLERNSKNRFKYSFMAFCALIKGWEYCKLVIFVDDSFLKNKFDGMLFTACAIDTNEQIFPLAFGVGDSENDASREWLFTKLRHAYGNREELCIVSDHHKSIEKVVCNVYPSASYGFYIYYLQQNLKKKFPFVAGLLSHAFLRAARSCVIEDFEYYMKQFDDLHRGICTYLKEVGYKKCSRVFFEERRYSIMIDNIAQSMNSVDVEAQNLLIQPLFEKLRDLLQDWFYKRRNQTAATMTTIATAQEDV